MASYPQLAGMLGGHTVSTYPSPVPSVIPVTSNNPLPIWTLNGSSGPLPRVSSLPASLPTTGLTLPSLEDQYQLDPRRTLTPIKPFPKDYKPVEFPKVMAQVEEVMMTVEGRQRIIRETNRYMSGGQTEKEMGSAHIAMVIIHEFRKKETAKRQCLSEDSTQGYIRKMHTLFEELGQRLTSWRPIHERATLTLSLNQCPEGSRISRGYVQYQKNPHLNQCLAVIRNDINAVMKNLTLDQTMHALDYLCSFHLVHTPERQLPLEEAKLIKTLYDFIDKCLDGLRDTYEYHPRLMYNNPIPATAQKPQSEQS
ncbi:hypothetical protein EHSB41UT_02464 [Parendozoicomonas haliclonae]|uniref:Uncharacterized protein n=1 Tax=Parendozoicomonas haliclonae TaxID=1960125 RepID=A0A1X7AK75_9GAMM|nr:hypothetical protein EHSB41UT_02464 [Parendozoicomonas haliclonae]